MSALPGPERWHEIDGLLQRALDLDAGARATFLDELAARDSDAARTVARLVVAAGDDDAPDAPAATIAAAVEALDAGEAPERIGEWRVLHSLGHGGMADV